MPPNGYTRAKDIYSNVVDMNPALCYLSDHHVDILHIGSHGSFVVGNQSINCLPQLNGIGRFRIRQKHSSQTRTVQFSVLSLEKSNIDLHNKNHLNFFISKYKD